MRSRMTAAYLDTQPALLEKWSSMNPLGRIGRPDEIRGVVTWLASDASSFCTGSECVLFFSSVCFISDRQEQHHGYRRSPCVVR